MKQELVEVNRQVTVVGPHTMEVLRGELEGMSARLDQVQVSVPAAVAPVKDGLSMLQEKLAAVEIKKLDAAVRAAGLPQASWASCVIEQHVPSDILPFCSS